MNVNVNHSHSEKLKNDSIEISKNKLGFGDNKVSTPKSTEDVIGLLAQIMAAAVNNSIEIDAAKLALNAATRIIEAQQADTRMKALAIATNRTISKNSGWALVDAEPKQIEIEG
jgi:hypothetical protein